MDFSLVLQENAIKISLTVINTTWIKLLASAAKTDLILLMVSA
jgi:hypothetical protein